MRSTTRTLLGLPLLLLFCACGDARPAATGGASTSGGSTTSTSSSGSGAPSTTAVTALQVAQESLQVDKVGPSDGMLAPDGAKDLVFTAQVTGPITVLYLVSSWPNGNPNGNFQANTLVGDQPAPKEFGGELEEGKFTAGIGVQENGAFLNEVDGSLKPIGPGSHTLTLYAANNGTLTPGSHVTLWAQASDGTLVKGPVITLQ